MTRRDTVKRLIAIASVAAIGLALPAVSAADSTVVAIESAGSSLSAYGRAAAWSSQRTDGRFVLRIYAGGRVTTLPVRSSRGPFDVDLGPDSKGRLVAVYSRCANGNADVPKDCRLFRYRPGGGESRIRRVSRSGYSEHGPTIWRSRIAFARYRNPITPNGPVVDRIYLRSDGRTRELPRGTLRSGNGPADTTARALQLDLRGTRVALSWSYLKDRCRTTPLPDPESKGEEQRAQAQLWLLDAAGSRRLIAGGCTDDQDRPFAPQLGAGVIRYQLERPGPPFITGGSQRTVLRAVTLSGVPRGTRRLPDAVIASAATDEILATSRFVAQAADSAVGTYQIAIDR